MVKRKISKSNRRLWTARDSAQASKEISLPYCQGENIVLSELEVHQAELELQKEELLNIQMKLQESRDQFHDLFDYAPIGYFTLNSEFKITGVNLTGSQLLKKERSHLLNIRFTRFIDAAETDRFYLFFKKAISTYQPQALDLKMLRADKSAFYAHLESSTMGDFDLRLAMIDISDRKLAEDALAKAREGLEMKVKERTVYLEDALEKLEQSEERFRTFQEITEDGFAILKAERDEKGEIKDFICQHVNPAASRIIRSPLHKLIGKRMAEIFPEAADKGMESQFYVWKRVVDSGRQDLREFSYRLYGKMRWFTYRAVKMGDGVALYIVDFTERKRLEQHLNEYARRITQAQEDERKRIAYELHDDTAQYLSILKLELESLLESGEIRSPKALEKLKFLKKDADRAFNDVRRYSHELRPAVLDKLGLRVALEQAAEDINKIEPLDVEVEVKGEEPNLPDEIKLGLFRIAQEALNNARKHACATRVNVNIQYVDGMVKVRVVDNGIGFDRRESTDRSGKRGSLGLMSMEERARIIGADLRISSFPGSGTAVTAEVKLKDLLFPPNILPI